MRSLVFLAISYLFLLSCDVSNPAERPQAAPSYELLPLTDDWELEEEDYIAFDEHGNYISWFSKDRDADKYPDYKTIRRYKARPTGEIAVKKVIVSDRNGINSESDWYFKDLEDTKKQSQLYFTHISSENKFQVGYIQSINKPIDKSDPNFERIECGNDFRLMPIDENFLAFLSDTIITEKGITILDQWNN